MLSHSSFSLSPQKALFLMTPIFFAANCKDPCKKPFLNEDKCNALDKEIVDIILPTAELRVTDFQPSEVDAGISFDAIVTGKGFEAGAMVQIGEKTYSTEFVSATELAISVNPMNKGTFNVTVTNPTELKHTLFDALQVGLSSQTAERCESLVVYFDLNKDRLTPESEKQIFESSACWLRTNAKLVVEGHCDERGTTEYNIALGQRRADSVQRFLLSQGLQKNNLKSVSHGEEKPAVRGQSEAAYSKNRRVEISVQ